MPAYMTMRLKILLVIMVLLAIIVGARYWYWYHLPGITFETEHYAIYSTATKQ